MTYEWKVLNIREARRAVFDTALLHFGIFAFCCFWLFREGRRDTARFSAVQSNE